MSLCNHYERFKGSVREELNARAAGDGVPPMPGLEGDVHGFFRTWLEQGAMFEHIASFWKHQGEGNVAFVHYKLAAYASRIAELLPADAAAWLERGRAALPQ